MTVKIFWCFFFRAYYCPVTTAALFLSLKCVLLSVQLTLFPIISIRNAVTVSATLLITCALGPCPVPQACKQVIINLNCMHSHCWTSLVQRSRVSQCVRHTDEKRPHSKEIYHGAGEAGQESAEVRSPLFSQDRCSKAEHLPLSTSLHAGLCRAGDHSLPALPSLPVKHWTWRAGFSCPWFL